MGPVTHDRGPLARNAFPLRSVLAPPSWSFGAPVGVAAVAVASAADAFLGSGAAFVAALAAVLVVTALLSRRGEAIVIGVAAVAATALGALWTDWDTAEQALALAVVGAVAVSAFLVAHLRATAAVTARQLQI